jgi:hypothetical protein
MTPSSEPILRGSVHASEAGVGAGFRRRGRVHGRGAGERRR